MFFNFAPGRRRFLQTTLSGVSAIGIGTRTPFCFAQAAESETTEGGRILVVVQLSGGNDGLNTVVPYADEAYHAARPNLALAASEVLTCDSQIGLHPAMTGLHALFEAGHMSVVQGVGYPQPNRSHFEAMDIWHTCKRKTELREDGWLGRFLDTQHVQAGGDVPALHLGREQQPFAIASRNLRVPTVRDLAEFQLRGGDSEQLRDFLNASLPPAEPGATHGNELLDFLQSSTTSALAASQRVSQAAQGYQAALDYPTSELGGKLKTIAQLIDAGLTTRVYYVQLDGFDTHAQQPPTHANLLREWSDAVSIFVRDLIAHDHGNRVCVMSFSEFGRRVGENASQGTDHGAAGPMFICGQAVRSQLVGSTPSLTDLQDGDLKFHIDFRQVYASILESWLGVDAAAIVGGNYETLPLFG